MVCTEKQLFLAVGVASACFLTGCVSTTGSAQHFAMGFLPPAPKTAIPETHLIVDAPIVSPNPYLSDSGRSFSANLTVSPKPSQTDSRLKSADKRFQDGKRFLAEGNVTAARDEFDAAVDLLLGTPESAPDRQKAETKLEQLVSQIHKLDVNKLGAGDFSTDPGFDKAPLEDILDLTFPVDPKLAPKVKEQIQAAVSQLPLELNDSVLSYINYFSTEKGHRTLVAGLKRAGRYRPMISHILREEGVPQELIYLAQAESGFLPRAVSNKAAVGMWQFVQFRGRQYGLMQSPYHDDRLDPEKATRSAARHLRDLYEKFGDWYLAIAGYNCGDGCVDRAVQRTGYADFWQIRARNAIPRETTNYVPIILAMTIMHKNAKDYGLTDIDAEAPLLYENVHMSAPTHVALLADAADRSASEIRDMNPALLGSVAPAGIDVHLPPGSRTQVLAALETIPTEKRASWRIHRVGEGDTLEGIAKRYNMPVSAITSANNVSEAEMGDVLVIPTASQLERTASSSKKGHAARAVTASSHHAVKATKTASARTVSSSAKRTTAAAKPAHRRIASR